MKGRGSGILLHLTSLPSPFGIGDMGPGAYKFVDFLSETKQRYWQILPLNPTDLAHGNSPYHSASAFACNPLLISPERLVKEGLLAEEDLLGKAGFGDDRVDYPRVTASKERFLGEAFRRFKHERETQSFRAYCEENAYWLEDYALFMALKSHFPGRAWSDWPEELRDRERGALESARKTFQDAIEKERFLQYLFFRQWQDLKGYAHGKGVSIIGDMPVYVVHDSADVWVHPELFKLDQRKRPYMVAGVPPDYFSQTGQLWGNPVYRWDVLEEQGYSWWIQRIAHNLNLYDFLRIDHFRGFLSYWEVPADEKNAVKGKWVEGPSHAFFKVVLKHFPNSRIIAEDLGFITPDVWELMDHYGLPGMKVLLFAFGDDLPTNPYAPHNHRENCVVYTGTHDNNTTRGWWEKEATPEVRKRLRLYLGREVSAEEVHWELVRLAMMSVARMTIIPIQDILGLSEEARMNRPAKREGNWRWRLLPGQLTHDLKRKLLEMTEIYGRASD